MMMFSQTQPWALTDLQRQALKDFGRPNGSDSSEGRLVNSESFLIAHVTIDPTHVNYR